MSNAHGIIITPSAQDYLAYLLAKQETKCTGVRVFITSPGLPSAETCLVFCRKGEQNDVRLELEKITIYIEPHSVTFLEEAVVDFKDDRMGGQLTIKAPNAKRPIELEDRVNYVLNSEINPRLALHGGDIRLVNLTEDKVAVLQFGGGCQGCAAVNLTLKAGVERTLLEHIPELTGILDVTDHRSGKG